MRFLPFTLLTSILLVPAFAQERSGPKKNPAFPEAIEIAKKNVEQEKLGAAIAALQAAIKDLQKKQRAAVLAALPRPEGWSIRDQEADEQADQVSAGLLGVGHSTSRRYDKGDANISVEITANSPLMQMMTMLFNNPTLIEADGGELVKYGPHKAILKKSGDAGVELMLLMHDQHLIKITGQGIDGDGLLRIFDQAFVDRLEKPLGK
jgi:hypothetical protein